MLRAMARGPSQDGSPAGAMFGVIAAPGLALGPKWPRDTVVSPYISQGDKTGLSCSLCFQSPHAMAAGPFCEPESTHQGFINLFGEEIELHYSLHQFTRRPTSGCVGENAEWDACIPEEKLLGQTDQRHQPTARVAPRNSPEFCKKV